MNIFVAAEKGNIPRVRQLLRQDKTLVNSRNKYGSTPLIRATVKDQFPMVIVLVDNGALVNDKNVNGETPLSNAAQVNNLDMVKFLLESGADINYFDNYMSSAIYWAVSSGNAEMVEFLIDNGSKINKDKKDDSYPLENAVRKDNLEIVKLLIKKGAIVYPELMTQRPEIHRKEYTEIVNLLNKVYEQQTRKLITTSSRMFGSKNLGLEVNQAIAEAFVPNSGLKPHEIMYYAQKGRETAPGEFTPSPDYMKKVREHASAQVILYTKENKRIGTERLYKLIEPMYGDILNRQEILDLIGSVRKKGDINMYSEYLYSRGYNPDTVSYVNHVLFEHFKSDDKLVREKLQGVLTLNHLEKILEFRSLVDSKLKKLMGMRKNR